MNKILFVRPPFEGMNDFARPHMGIAVLYSACESSFGTQFEYIFLDCFLEKLSVSETIGRVLEIRPDLIAFTVKSMQVEQTLDIIKGVKATYSPIIVCGGNHVNVEPELFVQHGSDHSIIGAGEKALVEIISYYFLSKENQSKPSKIINGDGDISIMPNWDIMDIHRYSEDIHVDYTRKALPVMASRGCPYACDFCSSRLAWGTSVKYRQPQEVISEIASNITRYGISDVHFYDDNLMLKREWMIEFFDIIEQQNVKFNWICLSRPEIIYNNRDLLPQMKKAGCVGFELGFETMDDALYSVMNKKNSASSFQKVCLEICDNDFDMIEVLIMLFYDGETFSTIYQTYKQLRKMQAERKIRVLSSRFFATPLMGTAFSENINDKGLSLSKGYKHINAVFLNFIPYSFLNSVITEFYINGVQLKFKYRLLSINCIIYKHEFKEICNLITMEEFAMLFNQMPDGSTIYDFLDSLSNFIKYSGDIKPLYEFMALILEFAISVGSVYAK